MTPKPQRWYFAFSSQCQLGIAKLCHPRFRHVQLFAELDNGWIMQVDPLRGFVMHGYTNEWKLHEVITRLKDLGQTVVMIRHTPDIRRTIPRGWAITCASYCAYTIGLPFWGVTPYQLYRKLLKQGAAIA